MYNQSAYILGTKGSMIRDIAEYGDARAAAVGADKVYNFTIGNPSIPTPDEVTRTIRELLDNTDSVTLHSYTPALGLLETRQAIADDLNARFCCNAKAEELFIGNGASSELCAVFQALSFPGAEFLAIAPYFTEYAPFVTSTGSAFKVVPADTEHFQIDMDAYIKRAQMVQNAEIYRGTFAIALWREPVDVGEFRIIASQAADEMLNIENVNASFAVFCDEKTGTVHISGRSLGLINVQLIAEALGGGGHQTMAAAQLQNIDPEDGIDTLKNAIDRFLEENKQA